MAENKEGGNEKGGEKGGFFKDAFNLLSFNLLNFRRKTVLEKGVKNTLNLMIGYPIFKKPLFRHRMPLDETESIVMDKLNRKQIFNKHNTILSTLSEIEHDSSKNYALFDDMYFDILEHYKRIGPFRTQAGIQKVKNVVSSGEDPLLKEVIDWAKGAKIRETGRIEPKQCDWLPFFFEYKPCLNKNVTVKVGTWLPVPVPQKVPFEDPEILDWRYEYHEGDNKGEPGRDGILDKLWKSKHGNMNGFSIEKAEKLMDEEFNRLKYIEVATFGSNQIGAWMELYCQVLDELKEQMVKANIAHFNNTEIEKMNRKNAAVQSFIEKMKKEFEGGQVKKRIQQMEEHKTVYDRVNATHKELRQFADEDYQKKIDDNSPYNLIPLTVKHKHHYDVVVPRIYKTVMKDKKDIRFKAEGGTPFEPDFPHEGWTRTKDGKERVFKVVSDLKDHGWDKLEREIGVGLDENGWPLEVDKHGRVLTDKHIYGTEGRKVPDDHIRRLDPLEYAAYIYNMWDEVRDTYRDARYHPKTLTIMDHVMAYSGVCGKEWKLKWFNHPLPKNYGKFKMNVYTTNPQAFKGASPTRTKFIEGKRTAADLNPGFDLRALHKDSPVVFPGKLYYYDVCNWDVETDESPDETYTTRGTSMYIINMYIALMKKFPDLEGEFKNQLQHIKEFDFGPRLFGPKGKYNKWPFKIDFKYIHDDHDEKRAAIKKKTGKVPLH